MSPEEWSTTQKATAGGSTGAVAIAGAWYVTRKLKAAREKKGATAAAAIPKPPDPAPVTATAGS